MSAHQAGAETSSDGAGRFALDLPAGNYNIQAHPPASAAELLPHSLHLELSGDREIGLFLRRAVTISGTFDLPAGFEGPPFVHLQNLADPLEQAMAEVSGTSFQAIVPAGVYAIQVTRCGAPPVHFTSGCSPPLYFARENVDATQGSVSGVTISEAIPQAPVVSTQAPVASLVQVGPADEDGIATVSGAPGATPEPATIFVVNLHTGQYNQTASAADGSFALRMFAPPGSYLSVHQDPSGMTVFGAEQPGTIVRVPLSGDEGVRFAGGSRINLVPDQVPALIPVLGAEDTGQVWVTGDLVDRDWNAGDRVSIGGRVEVISRNLSDVHPSDIGVDLTFRLERVFDAAGAQDFANPQFMSPVLTPTGFPAETAVGDAIAVGYTSTLPGDFSRVGEDVMRAEWQTDLSVPGNLPAGVYQLMVDIPPWQVHVPESSELHLDGVFPTYFEPINSPGAVALVLVGSPQAGRMRWALALDDFSNGSRGTVALEDADRFQVAGHVSAQHLFVIPPRDRRTGAQTVLDLQPFAPLVGTADRNWQPPPRLPIAFPSGSLTATVTRPDGRTVEIGSAPFRQSRIKRPFSHLGAPYAGPTRVPSSYYQLTTLDPRFDVAFEQYGRHVVSLDGFVEDIHGARYGGSGTYEVFVAEILDLETGVMPGTPFEVGDVFSPALTVQPGVPAEVEVRVRLVPNSDPAQAIDMTVAGRANRFGYFQPRGSDSLVMSAPGEYRVDIVARYEDENGVLWMGAATWGSVVETPGSPLVTHGRRGFEAGAPLQWFGVRDDPDPDSGSTHIHYPFHRGDIMWMNDTEIEFDAVAPILSLQDTQGSFADLVRQRVQSHADGGFSGGFEERVTLGEIPLFSSSGSGLPPAVVSAANTTHWGYFYTTVARPGVLVRDFVTNDSRNTVYWRFDGHYNFQLGSGLNGDLQNDFKFQFGGAVYRAPDENLFYYGGYGSFWVLLPDDDPVGGRVMPPFQGAAGGPSGGPIMTLKGEEVDIFFLPRGVRAGSILEVGDRASFSGQVAPTLDSMVSLAITSPSGAPRQIAGRANKVGYFYHPSTDFVVDEPGVWTVDVTVWHEGQTSAGPVQPPFPTGDVLGSRAGQFYFYAVERSSEPLEVSLPERSFVRAGEDAVSIPVSASGELDAVGLHYTTVMPGFILEEGTQQSLTYHYDAPRLAQDFPNLDLRDPEGKFGIDTVTMSFLAEGRNETGDIEYRARQILLQGEELLAPAQPGLEPCNPGPESACLFGDGFKIEGEMKSFGDTQEVFPTRVMSFPSGRAESDQAVFFESFNQGNFEIGVKMVDACDLPDDHPLKAYWAFFGGLTNAETEIRVTDTVTGEVVTWSNPARTFPQTVGDTSAFPCVAGAPMQACARSDERACLIGERFQVEGEMESFAEPPEVFPARVMSFPGGRAESTQAVFFESFNQGNFEVGVKMVDGCGNPVGHPLRYYWVFYGGLTNAETRIRVTQMSSGLVDEWVNPPRSFPQSVGRTQAFPCD